MLWELLTLDIPFRAMEQPRLLFIIAMYNYTLYIPPGVPDLFVQLLKGLLHFGLYKIVIFKLNVNHLLSIG